MPAPPSAKSPSPESSSNNSAEHTCDCLIIGGGITGAGIARDAAIRGLKALLIESNDFASGTSHVTSKLIHGGLRYLPQGRFRLVMEGVSERHRLLNHIAPHLVRPLRFIVPYPWKKFVNWLTTATGIHSYGFIEWFRNGRGCPPLFGPRLRREFPSLLPHPLAVSYWDAQANDARLVMSVLRSANQRGATLMNYTAIETANFVDGLWRFRLHRSATAEHIDVHARVVVTAAGPWSPEVSKVLGLPVPQLMWIKGSHILLRRPDEFGNDAIVIRSIRDGRLLWVIPWERRLIVGTTESHFTGDLRNVRAQSTEVDDLFQSFIHYFPTLGMTRNDLVGTYAGVRPIIAQEGNSENKLSRRHQITVDDQRHVVSVNGGKLTTFRRMAEETCDQVQRLGGNGKPSREVRDSLRNEIIWPGLSRSEILRLEDECAKLFPIAQRPAIKHLVSHYGPDAKKILARMHDQTALSQSLANGLPYALAELDYLVQNEWVVHLLDLIKRRTPLYFQTKLHREKVTEWATALAPILNWNPERIVEEVDHVMTECAADQFSLSPNRHSATAVIALNEPCELQPI